VEGSKGINTVPGGVPVAPVQVSERIGSVDVMRGVAVLGILAINIFSFALPNAVLKNPPIAGGFTGANLATWIATHMFFYHKFMPIFSMLFGGGLILLASRLESKGIPLRGVYYRRILWLLLFGLCHAYLLWIGDILYFYAVCGLFIYLFRRKSARTLIILGVIIYLIVLPLQHGLGRMFGFMRDTAEKAEVTLAEGETLDEAERGILEGWRSVRRGLQPTGEELDDEIEIYRDGYAGIVSHRAQSLIWMQTMATIFYFLWRIGGLMLIGMGLMKTGFFSASRSTRFYVSMLVPCYLLGFSIVYTGMQRLMANGFDIVYVYKAGAAFNVIGGPLVALGHISVVMLVCKAGVFSWLTSRLASVGRMAFSNYISQTVVCTTIFYGYGLGLFARYDRFRLMGFVLAVWIVQLVVSPIWLKRFRFGPLEWLWRTLTYGRAQPFRIGAP
jgi:uncharacterized protein